MTQAIGTVEYSVSDGIAWVAVGHPPVNALSLSVRVALIDAMDRAESDDTVRVIVLLGHGHTFPAGSDVAEYDAPLSAPLLSDVCARLEACAKPVVASLHGTVLGGGLELALAAHYRVAHGATRVGLPEVKLGLVPGAGGTQRVPRLLGAADALEMMLSGVMYPVSRAPARALVEEIVQDNPIAAASAYCHKLMDAGSGPRPTSARRAGFADPAAYQAEVNRRRLQTSKQPESAPKEIVAAVEAALLLPFEAGLAFEADAFESCRASEQSRALRAAFFAERRAQRFGLPKGTELPDLGRIAVLGGGMLATQIVIGALNAGLGVNWGTRDPEPLRTGVAQVRDVFRQGIARGGLSEAQAEERLALLRVGDSAHMTQGADMIVHAARGQGDVPAPEGAVRAVAFPGRVDGLGLRFAPPAYGTRLVEVIEGPICDAGDLAAALSLAKALGKIPVKVRSSGDSLAGQLMSACQRAADALIDVGQSPYVIDRAFRDWGWSRPPFEYRDLTGFTEVAAEARGPGARNWSAGLAEEGRTGRASGRGFYDWRAEGGAPCEDRDVLRRLDALRAAAKPLPQDRIRTLILGAMANEGAHLLRKGVAARPSDLDVVCQHAIEMPRWRGGPMHLAGVIGLLAMKRALEHFDHPDRGFWTPDPMFDELIKNGRRFDDLNV